MLSYNCLKLKYLFPFYVSYFQLVHTNQELFEKHICNQVTTIYEKYDGAVPQLSSETEVCIRCPSLSAMFNSLYSSMNQELFEKNLCNENNHYEKYNNFHCAKEAITCNHQFSTFHCQQR